MPKFNIINITILLAVAMGVLLPAYNIYILQPSLLEALTQDTEQDAIRTAKHISSMVFPDQRTPLKSELDSQQKALLNNLIDDFSLSKLKAFNLEGMIIYSTDPKDFGVINSKPYFRNKLLKGETYTKLVNKGGNTLEGQSTSIEVVETYVPIYNTKTIIGVFEIYYDITANRTSLNSKIHQSSLFLATSSIVFICLFSLLGLRFKKTAYQHLLAEQKIKKLAYYDTLTELPNSTLFLDRLNQALHRCERDGQIAALLYLDLDHFKEVNDTFGHAAGDAVLIHVAETISSKLRKQDHVSRFVCGVQADD